jgi:hypothetical protein
MQDLKKQITTASPRARASRISLELLEKTAALMHNCAPGVEWEWRCAVVRAANASAPLLVAKGERPPSCGYRTHFN